MLEHDHEWDDAAEWVELLVADARQSAVKTTCGLDDMAEQVMDMGGAVAHLAAAVGRLAETVRRTQVAATDTRHAVTATDWFWQQCKAVVGVHAKAVAGWVFGWVAWV